MKTIGLVGGVSWQASAEYYRIINQETQSRLGPNHSAKLVMVSLDFEPIARLEHEGNWAALTTVLSEAVSALENAGSDFVLIASNTLHRIASELQNNINVPLIHIADAVADAILAENISTVGLLGTNFVMEESFYRDILSNRGIKVIVPDKPERNYVHTVIYNELSAGRVSLGSQQEVLRVIEKLNASGCSAVLLANTELPLLIRETDSPTRLFDSLTIHARAGVALAIA
jgi:aspartate racemase